METFFLVVWAILVVLTALIAVVTEDEVLQEIRFNRIFLMLLIIFAIT